MRPRSSRGRARSCARAIASQPYSPSDRGARRGAPGSRARRDRPPDRCSSAASASGSSGATSRAAPRAPISLKPPTSPRTIGLPNARPACRTPDCSISRYGQREHVGAAQQGRDLRIGDEAGQEADGAGRAGRQLAQRLHRHPRHAGDPELRARGRVHPRERLEQGVHPLVLAEQAEEEDHRAVGPVELGRQRSASRARSGSRAARAGSRGLARARGPTSATSRRAPASVWEMTASKRESSRRWTRQGAALAGGRQRVVQRERSRPPGRARAEQEPVRDRQRDPLPVGDVGAPEASPGPEHVGHVGEGLQRQAPSRSEPGGGAAIGRSTRGSRSPRPPEPGRRRSGS